MAIRQLPDAELLRKLLRYDPYTGKLYWRERTPDLMGKHQMIDRETAAKNWNRRFAEKPALSSSDERGYLRGTLLCKTEFAHRIIWKMVTGDEPDQIDHINGKRADNRWCNLRSIPQAENTRNACRDRRNLSGCPGVRRTKNQKAWVARITIRQRVYHLGTFDILEDAIRVRKAAERQYGFHPNHGRSRR